MTYLIQTSPECLVILERLHQDTLVLVPLVEQLGDKLHGILEPWAM
jgi:hypothetical protein